VKLYMTHTCPFVHRVLIAMKLRQIDPKTIECIEVDLSSPPSTLLEINPFGSVPTLELEPGYGFNESHVVMEFIDTLNAPGARLFGESPAAIAHTKAQIEAASSRVLTTIQMTLYAFGSINTLRKAEAALPACWDWLEAKLARSKGDYLGGTTLNAIDVSLAPFIARLQWVFEKYPQLPKPPTSSKTAHYIARLSQHPAVSTTLPTDGIVRSSLHRFLNPHPLLQGVIEAPRVVIENPEEVVSKAGDALSSWKIMHDGKGFCLKANFTLKSNSDAVEKLSWLHDAQETSDHHTSLVLRDFQNIEITLVTHEPKWGVSQKDLALARAIQTFFIQGKLP